MPLIIISGYPSSGKTHRSQQLVELFQSKIQTSSDARTSKLSVHHINDQSLGLDRSVYKEAKTEKDARAVEYSAIKRHLGKDTIIIADGLNYIKGFRYQLYCDAKAVHSPSCVVHVGTPIEKCREINDRKLAEEGLGGGYQPDLFENLVFRYEEPNGMSRWDSPLFTVPFDDEQPPFEQIWEAMIGSEGNVKTAKPNLATVAAPATDSNYLYELDQITQQVVSNVLDWQKNHPGEGGAELKEEDAVITLPPNPATLPQLQRMRRQFITMNRQHKLVKARIRSSFVEYLTTHLSSA